MTPLRVSLVAAGVSLVLLFVVFELIRTRRLRERYALLWLLTAGVLLTLSLWRTSLDTIAGLVGISYAPSLLFVVGLVFVIVVLLHYSTVLSRLSDENAILAQRVALLEAGRRAGGLELEAGDDEGPNARVRALPVDELSAAGRDPESRRRIARAAGH